MAASSADLTEMTIAGRTFQVGPLTMGQRRAVAKVLKTVPPPPIPQVNVLGLVEAMYMQGPRQEEAVEQAAGPKLKFAELEHIRRTIQNTVQEMVREARARVENWPPPVEAAQELILNDEKVQEVFLWEVLRLHNTGFSRTDVPGLMEEMGFHELIDLFDITIRPAVQAAMRLARGVDEDPKARSSGPAGDP